MTRFADATVRLSESYRLNNLSWEILPGQVWAIVGANGSGKSALAAVLAGEGVVTAGTIENLPAHPVTVSFETQQALIDRERERDDSDITDEVFEGTPVVELLAETSVHPERLENLIAWFGFGDKLARGFRKLSTGETRKVLLMRALTADADMLILDEPFDGLDAASAPRVRDLLGEIAAKTPTVMVVNRFDEIPDYVTHLLLMDDGRITEQVLRDDDAAFGALSQLFHLRNVDIEIPAPDPADRVPALDPGDPLVRLAKGRVAWGDNVVFEDLDWTINPGHHWQVTGPNGSGKTCLLNLITGDNPQCYANDLFVFGFQRGQGESIWEIKQHIGYVSSALQWDYRVTISCRNVIISGFYDSIGLYTKATDVQLAVADKWLALMGMSDRAGEPFNKLSYGDQRLLLIARAMVKHPHLLILDEPCLGLDDLNRQLVLALIEKICAGAETTVLYVNHHEEDAIPSIANVLAL